MRKLLIAPMLISNIAFGALPSPQVVHLTKGQLAPYEGNLFNLSATKSAYDAEQQLPQYKLLNESLQTEITLKDNIIEEDDKKVQLFQTDNINLYNSLQKSKETTTLEKVLYFGAGVIITCLAIDGASKLR